MVSLLACNRTHGHGMCSKFCWLRSHVHRGNESSKENRQNFGIFWIFPVYGKSCLRWTQIGPGGFFPTNPDLADILGRTDLNFENFYFFICWTPTFWISRSPDLQISGFSGPQISRFPDFQTPPTAPAPAPPDEFSDPNLTPLPTHPGTRHIARALAATVTTAT